MGSLWGHLDEGLAFVIIATWWIINLLNGYIQCGGSVQQFKAQISYDCKIRGRLVPIEIYWKLFISVGGFLIELFEDTPYFIDEEGKFRNVSGLQHMSIFVLFFLHAVLDFLRYYKLLYIEGLDYLTLAMSFGWYGAIFYFHTQSDETELLEDTVHLLAILWCLFIFASILWEYRSTEKFLPHYCRALLVFCLGTWFIHTPFLLFSTDSFPGENPNPRWDRTDPLNAHAVAASFAVHLFVNVQEQINSMCSEKQRVLLLTIASIVLQSVVCKDINTRFLERFTLSPTSTRSPSTTSSPAGVWSTWSSWSACSVTCSAGLRFRARHCVGTSSCAGDIYESEYCSMPRCLHVVDGQWSPWGSWMDCSVTCGTGIKERNRSCDNPAPQDGGKQCSGRPYELSACKIKECPIDGGWSNYTVRPCSKTCGLGVVVSLRTCSEPAPLYGGKPCQGSPTKFEACKQADCIIDGAWSSWTNFTDCSVICGDGHRRRWRKCSAPAPQNGGKNCTGHSHDMDDCTNGNCPKDIKTCDKQKVNNTLTAKTVFQPSCETGNDVTSQVDMINKLCNAPRNESQWELGIAIADNCEAIPLRTPIGLVNRSTREKKYGILLDCYQQILEFATQNCTSGITIQTINLTASATDYHMLLW